MSTQSRHGIPIQAVSPSGEVLREYISIKSAADDSYMSTTAVVYRCNHYGEPNVWLHSPEMKDYTFRYKDFLQKQPKYCASRRVIHCPICMIDSDYNIVDRFDSIQHAALSTGFSTYEIYNRINHKVKREWSDRYSFRREIDIDLLGKRG